MVAPEIINPIQCLVVSKPVLYMVNKVVISRRLRQLAMDNGLKDFEVVSVFTDDGATITAVRSSLPPDRVCPYCRGGRRLNGFRTARFRDRPRDGGPTFIAWERQQYRCASCLRPSQDTHPGFDDRRYLTCGFIDWVAQEGIRRTFAELAKESGMHRENLREVFRETTATAAAAFTALSGILAIELIPLAGRERPALIDFGNRIVVDVYPTWAACVEYLAILRLNEAPIPADVVLSDIALEEIDSKAIDKLLGLFATKKLSSSPSSVRRTGLRLMLQSCDALIVSCAQRERLSVKFARVLFARPLRKLGRPARHRLQRWRHDEPQLYGAYQLKEQFWEIWTTGRPEDWSSWRERTRSLLPTIDFGPICELVETRLEYLIRCDDIDLATLSFFPGWLDTILSLCPEGKTHSFTASRAALLSRCGPEPRTG